MTKRSDDGEKLISLDSRRRISLGKLAKHSMYFAYRDELGVITLTPVRSVNTTDGVCWPIEWSKK